MFYVRNNPQATSIVRIRTIKWISVACAHPVVLDVPGERFSGPAEGVAHIKNKMASNVPSLEEIPED